MKSLSAFLPTWTEAVGWTLLNSLWQSLLVLLLVILVLRLIPSLHSQARYVFSCVALLFFVAINVLTLAAILNNTETATSALSITLSSDGSSSIGSTLHAISISSFSESFISWIDSSMNWIITAWFAGALFFSLRMITGWWYVDRLKSEANIVTDEWSDLLQSLSAQLGVKQIVTLAQSTKIETPVVLGFVKPIVLVPIGMFSGLTTEQIETIFIHELAHIKRHDYLINLIQSFIETIFFFNPFIWIISNIIRREREYCCDDAVIQKRHNAAVYARALTTLEHARLSRSSFAVSLAENKNQLLNRIKRLMEKSVKNYSGKDRLIPALLLVIGLLCASWLTIKNEKTFTASVDDSVLQDTTKRKKKSGKSPAKITQESEKELSKDESGEPVTYTLSMKQPGADPLVYEFNFKNRRNWEELKEQFEVKFKDKFKDFYKNNSKDFDKLMEEMREKFEEDFELQQYKFEEHEFPVLGWQDWDEEAIAPIMAIPDIDVINPNELEELQALAEVDRAEVLEHLEELEALNDVHVEQLAEEMEEHALELQEHARDLEVAELAMLEMEGRMKSFERQLTKELVKDGYIKEGDEIKSINWDDNGSIEINGKKIKEADEKKYHTIHRKYFKSGNFRYVQ
jgi:bla regulator protein blaR1